MLPKNLSTRFGNMSLLNATYYYFLLLPEAE